MSLRKIENPDTFRANIRKKLNEKIKNETASLNLEKGIFNYALKEADQRKIVKKWDNKFFVQIYLSHLKSILENLNQKLIDDINNGSIKSHTIAFMTHQELNHDRWAELIEIKSKRDKNKFEVHMSASTDTFTCRKCHGNQCTYYLQQVRSADEPMTCYISCIQCGNKWKKN
jgi:DNA-directed RNA polymerase subunit M/transcription elongation factor TFIIS